jgi:hypothetical protein
MLEDVIGADPRPAYRGGVDARVYEVRLYDWVASWRLLSVDTALVTAFSSRILFLLCLLFRLLLIIQHRRHQVTDIVSAGEWAQANHPPTFQDSDSHADPAGNEGLLFPGERRTEKKLKHSEICRSQSRPSHNHTNNHSHHSLKRRRLRAPAGLKLAEMNSPTAQPLLHTQDAKPVPNTATSTPEPHDRTSKSNENQPAGDGGRELTGANFVLNLTSLASGSGTRFVNNTNGPCRAFATAQGCKFGARCYYVHERQSQNNIGVFLQPEHHRSGPSNQPLSDVRSPVVATQECNSEEGDVLGNVLSSLFSSSPRTDSASRSGDI